MTGQDDDDEAENLTSIGTVTDWARCLYRIDDLQTRFAEQSLARHWLPASLAPLLRTLVELAKRQRDELVAKSE